ncbi:beta-lactamase hydrolase domain-containing protein [Anabaena subtropica]|uniref:Protein tyrosine phosphatase family protein n=1 Tax=Anabaena subtropica FACHB-260 TaxID=2692884 RepID=A0ABR8CW59_9NOST|nr:protein tyrosine phosphatase family protein [Anabaena subtropica]MBD2347006.1 protein tyrosine phosphatase family protein [Anabaena subtropica FACHB-260]
MNTVRKINDQLAIAGQIIPDQFSKISEDGYKSVLNLRSPDEKEQLDNEKDKLEFLGLHYINLPVKLEEINHKGTLQVLQTIDKLPKPTLIHCDNSIRSSVIAFLYIATKQGISFEKALELIKNLGLLS